MIKGNHSPAPVAMHETKEVVRGREETPRRRKLTGDDVIVVMSNMFRVENSIILIDITNSCHSEFLMSVNFCKSRIL